jgi:uncharacterized protein
MIPGTNHRVDTAPKGNDADRLFQFSAPRSPLFHLIRTEDASHLLVVDGTRLFEIDPDTFDLLNRLGSADEGRVTRLFEEMGISTAPIIDDDPPEHLPVRALSLAVAQKCNLGCSYCYAHQGDFGGPAKNMTAETAMQSVDLLLSEAKPGERVNLAFLGGEPLINRPVLRLATERAARTGKERGITVTFSITTNGTLVNDDDADFFESYGFAVTVSLDGPQYAHDLLRPYKGGAGSFNRIVSNIRPLLERQRQMQVSARITVTPLNMELKNTLDTFVSMGFHSVGFSPLLNASSGSNEVSQEHLLPLLSQMLECGYEFEKRLTAGERYPFANLVNALREIHKGTHRPYPCGAGGGYFGVSADGELAACHRFVGDSEAAMGNVLTGIDRQVQALWLKQRHVHNQEPCRSCWARYMCGGGCHHEVLRRGRHVCDYIRGWLHYCLEAYSRLSVQKPAWFGPVQN